MGIIRARWKEGRERERGKSLECGRGRHILWRERRGDGREKGFKKKRSVRIPRASLTMINGGEWHWVV